MRWRSGIAGRGTKGSAAVDADAAAAVAFDVELRVVEGLSVMEVSPGEVEHLDLRSTLPVPGSQSLQMVMIGSTRSTPAQRAVA